jgi:serine phosphatase RsbU (regulator of sigma subunit)/anti-sigma regulatory factor (Ser/Thr protein kinase)
MRTRSRLRRRRPRRSEAEAENGRSSPDVSTPAGTAPASFDIAPNDPLLGYLQSAGGPVEIDRLRLDSPGLEQLRSAGVTLVVPLVSQGELIGVLSLGSRMSEQQYSADDRKLLDNLAGQAAPALRVAQLVREQEAEVRTRERYEQEMRLARHIQQNLLPHTTPELAGWQLGAFYRSATEVGGDFYDFIELTDGRMAIVIGDVTDHGVPAALMMASTRSVIRSVALRVFDPGQVLAQANDLLCPDMPPKMFVTCLYAVLEPATGRLVYANAGHNIPYRKKFDSVVDELRARGMPLGLLPGSVYEEKEVNLEPGEVVLFTSDGIAEAHNPEGEMFGCPRIIETVERHPKHEGMQDQLLSDLERFTGPDWEQEDDITMVTLGRATHSAADFERADPEERPAERIAEFTVPSAPGNERMAMQQVGDLIAPLDIDPTRLEKVKTAVAEATMNAIEHGNKNDPDIPVVFEIFVDAEALRIRITDRGGGEDIPETTAPDIDAKLRGEQTPRGWGLFLIRSMVDDMIVTSDDVHHTVELVVNLKGDQTKEGDG